MRAFGYMARGIAVAEHKPEMRAAQSLMRKTLLGSVSVANDGEIGWCAAVGNGFDDARRHEGERREVPDVALDFVLASGNRLE